MQLAPFENSPRFAIFHLKRVVYLGTDVPYNDQQISSRLVSFCLAIFFCVLYESLTLDYLYNFEKLQQQQQQHPHQEEEEKEEERKE